MEVSGSRPSVELSWGVKKQFYPTVVLLISLLRVLKFKPRRHVDHLLDTPLQGTELSRSFKDKLAFLCCTEYGPNAVSACTILKRADDTLEYVFAFNQVSRLDLNPPELKKGIEDILQLFLQGNPSATRKDAILSHVLSFNAIRVKGYLKSYQEHLRACIEACPTYEVAERERLLKRLEGLLSETERALGSSRSRNEVDALATRKLIASVYETYHSDDFRLVQAQVTREEQHSGFDQYLPWAELVHVSGRLISYKRAVEVCQMAFTRWPSLLESYEVVIVDSSTPTEKVLKWQALTAEGCMEKTTGRDSLLRRAFDAQYDTLRVHLRLDDKVAESWKSNPKPIVHSEMQLLHTLEHTEGGINKRRFFEGDMFIGTSKPPCRLCSYYFHACGTEVEIRPSHRNVYLPWRTPDVYDDEGVKNRDEVLKKIKQRLETDLYQILKNCAGDGRHHDSTNYSGAVGDQRWSDIGGSIRSDTRTPAMGEVSRPVSSFGMHGEEPTPSARYWGECEDAARKEPSTPVSSMEALLEAQMRMTGRAAASRDEQRQPALRSGASAYNMFAVENALKTHPSGQSTEPVVEDEDEDGGGVLLFSGRNRGTSLKGRADLV